MNAQPKTFSVLTVSKRTGWEQDAWQSISQQTKLPAHWVVVTENYRQTRSAFSVAYRGRGEAIKQLALQTSRTILPAPAQTRLSNLNASLNAGLRKITSDYVIFYQDFIELQPDCFEKLLALADARTFVTTCTPNYDGSDDSRYWGLDAPRACRPEEWEANVAIAPMAMIRALGGFDEEYDWGWSWDNVNLAERAAMLGARFILDESNRPELFPHEMSSHQTLPLNAARHQETMAAIRAGQRPLQCPYL